MSEINVNDVNARQVGGTHYKSALQHWDFVELNGIGYLEGCATKYIARNRKKFANPVPDLEKALHYTEKLITLHHAGKRDNRLKPGPDGVAEVSATSFCRANDLTQAEARIIRKLAYWRRAADLEDAIVMIRELIDAAKYPK